MEIITGRTGTPHVTSENHRNIIKSIMGDGSFIVDLYEALDAEIAANNILKIHSGLLIHHGCVSEIKRGTYDEVPFEPGVTGMLRKDLVVARYIYDAATDTESMNWHVITGTASETGPEVPGCTEGDMQNGDVVDDCPFAVITMDGLNASVETIIENATQREQRKIVEQNLRAHPVGSIYLTVDPRNPKEIFGGGTWVAWGAGRVPVGIDESQTEFNAVEKTGGEKTHKLITSEIPGHTHPISYTLDFYSKVEGVMSDAAVGQIDNSSGALGGTGTALSTGGSQPHNNLQPYITCYMWKRTA